MPCHRLAPWDPHAHGRALIFRVRRSSGTSGSTLHFTNEETEAQRIEMSPPLLPLRVTPQRGRTLWLGSRGPTGEGAALQEETWLPPRTLTWGTGLDATDCSPMAPGWTAQTSEMGSIGLLPTVAGNRIQLSREPVPSISLPQPLF